MVKGNLVLYIGDTVILFFISNKTFFQQLT